MSEDWLEAVIWYVSLELSAGHTRFEWSDVLHERVVEPVRELLVTGSPLPLPVRLHTPVLLDNVPSGPRSCSGWSTLTTNASRGGAGMSDAPGFDLDRVGVDVGHVVFGQDGLVDDDLGVDRVPRGETAGGGAAGDPQRMQVGQ